MPKFNDRLKELRKNKSMTQKQMAILLGITERHFQRYEAGEIYLSTDMTIRLSDFFEVSADYLLGRVDNKK